MSVRRDAARNRERLLAAALEAVTNATGRVSLEAIASNAGLGAGTFYRHFANRETLLEAVYTAELGKLCDSAALVTIGVPADRALRAWLGEYADFVATKRGMAEAVRALVGPGAVTPAATRERLTAAVASILDEGVHSDVLCSEVRAVDVVTAMAAIVQAGADRAQVDRLLNLLVAGVRSVPADDSGR